MAPIVHSRLLYLVLVLCGVWAATAASSTDNAQHRRLLREPAYLPGRQLLQGACGQCPDSATARATCSAVSASQLNSVRADLISKCSTVDVDPTQCCSLQGTSLWPTYAACACSDIIPGLSAFVDGRAVLAACGCGPRPTTTTTTPTTTIIGGRSSTSSNQSTTAASSSSSSSSVNMEAVYNAVIFPGGRGSSSGSSSSSSGGGTVTGTGTGTGGNSGNEGGAGGSTAAGGTTTGGTSSASANAPVG